MPFTFESIREDGLDITEIKSQQSGSSIQVIPSKGVLWHGWFPASTRRQMNLISHYAGKSDLEKNLSDSFKSAKLSPFACRIPEGKYTYEGRRYEFAHKFKDGNAIHGLLYNKSFTAGEKRSDDLMGRADFHYAYRKDDPGYPFDYDCTVSYTLHLDGRVTLETDLHNLSQETIPVVDGWHPYFTTGSRVNDCHLQFQASRIIEFDEKLIPTGKLVAYDSFLQDRAIGDTELDNAFMLDKDAPQPRCSFSDPHRDIAIHVYPSESYPVLQLYIPPDRSSLAIETLSGAPDAFNNGIGLVLLAPGESKTFSVTFQAAVG
jgi:aldose 1-epimerase